MNFFYPHIGLWGVLEGIDRAVVLIVFGYFCVHFLRKAKQINKTLREETSFFESINPRNLTASFPDIETRLQQNDLMKNLWHEFDSSLVKSGQSVSTTVESDFYFNEYVLVDIPLRLEFIRNVPGILTALGIIGTFLGVLAGLQGYDSHNVETVRTSVNNLLIGIQGAFLNSFLAIFFAVVCTGIEKMWISSLYSKVTRLQRAINRLFNRSLSDDYLHKMVDQMEEQTHSMKSFSQDLAETVKRALEELVYRQTQVISQANGELAASLGNTIVEQLSPSMERLSSVMEEVRREQSESNNDAIRQIVDQFQNALASSASTQLDEMMKAMAGTSELLSSLKDELGHFLKSIEEKTLSQQEILNNQLNAFSLQAKEGQDHVRIELLSFLEKISSTLGQVQSELTDRSVQSVKAVSEELTNLVARTSQQSEENMNLLGRQIVYVQEEMQSRMKELTFELSRVTSDSTGLIQTAVTETMQTIKGDTSSLLLATGKLNQQLVGRLDQLASFVETLASKTTDVTVELTGRLNEGSEKIAGLVKQVNDLMVNFGGLLGESGRLTGDMVSSAEKLRFASDSLTGILGDYRKEKENIQNYIRTFSDQIKQSDERFNQFKELYDHYRQSAEQIKDTVDMNKLVISSLENTIGDGLSKYVEVTRNSIGEYLSALDEQLTTAVKSLGSLMDELTENLEIFSEALERATTIRPGSVSGKR